VIFISPLAVNKNGMSDIYLGKPQAAYFEPVTRGVSRRLHRDPGRPCRRLLRAVGRGDRRPAVMISTLLPLGPNTSNPCPIAQKVAEAMIHHLQGAA
jgi:hypothetical protein